MFDKFSNSIFDIIINAGNIALNYYNYKNSCDIKVSLKDDNSPVSEVDLKINDFLIKHLQQLTPNLPILSEEQITSNETRIKWQNYWVIDPIDGTKHFINHQGQFSIMLSIFIKNHPYFSLIYNPIDHSCYICSIDNFNPATIHDCNPSKGKSFKILNLSQPNNFVELHSCDKFDLNRPIRVTHGHRNNMDSIYKLFNPKFNYEFIPYGSAGLKGGLVAEGKADIYISPHPAGIWDIAPAQALVEKSGGIVRDLSFNPIDYTSNNNFTVPPFFIGRDASWDWQEILNLR